MQAHRRLSGGLRIPFIRPIMKGSMRGKPSEYTSKVVVRSNRISKRTLSTVVLISDRAMYIRMI